jgi:hypothetical protein
MAKKACATMVELIVEGGLRALRCPITGIPVLVEEEGFDSDAPHSPHLRFFVDWIGQVWVVSPDQLVPEQAKYQEEIIKIWRESEDDATQNDTVAKCLKSLPPSCFIFEILDPPRGSYDGEICYVCFEMGEPAKVDRVTLTEA